MVESKPQSNFELMVKNQRGLCQIILFSFLDPKSLAKFCQINKSCKHLLDPRSKYCVNFQVLFQEQFCLELTPDEVAETFISTSRALQVALKCMMLESIRKSNRIIGTNEFQQATCSLLIPDLTMLRDKSWQELRNLKINQVQWSGFIHTIGFTLSDDQSCKAGTRDFNQSHTFDPTKKITRIETVITKDESFILQMNFYHHNQKLTSVGLTDDDWVRKNGGRREVFESSEDE